MAPSPWQRLVPVARSAHVLFNHSCRYAVPGCTDSQPACFVAMRLRGCTGDHPDFPNAAWASCCSRAEMGRLPRKAARHLAPGASICSPP